MCKTSAILGQGVSGEQSRAFMALLFQILIGKGKYYILVWPNSIVIISMILQRSIISKVANYYVLESDNIHVVNLLTNILGTFL